MVNFIKKFLPCAKSNLYTVLLKGIFIETSSKQNLTDIKFPLQLEFDTFA